MSRRKAARRLRRGTAAARAARRRPRGRGAAAHPARTARQRPRTCTAPLVALRKLAQRPARRGSPSRGGELDVRACSSPRTSSGRPTCCASARSVSRSAASAASRSASPAAGYGRSASTYVKPRSSTTNRPSCGAHLVARVALHRGAPAGARPAARLFVRAASTESQARREPGQRPTASAARGHHRAHRARRGEPPARDSGRRRGVGLGRRFRRPLCPRRARARRRTDRRSHRRVAQARAHRACGRPSLRRARHRPRDERRAVIDQFRRGRARSLEHRIGEDAPPLERGAKPTAARPRRRSRSRTRARNRRRRAPRGHAAVGARVGSSRHRAASSPARATRARNCSRGLRRRAAERPHVGGLVGVAAHRIDDPRAQRVDRPAAAPRGARSKRRGSQRRAAPRPNPCLGGVGGRPRRRAGRAQRHERQRRARGGAVGEARGTMLSNTASSVPRGTPPRPPPRRHRRRRGAARRARCADARPRRDRPRRACRARAAHRAASGRRVIDEPARHPASDAARGRRRPQTAASSALRPSPLRGRLGRAPRRGRRARRPRARALARARGASPGAFARPAASTEASTRRRERDRRARRVELGALPVAGARAREHGAARKRPPRSWSTRAGVAPPTARPADRPTRAPRAHGGGGERGAADSSAPSDAQQRGCALISVREPLERAIGARRGPRGGTNHPLRARHVTRQRVVDDFNGLPKCRHAPRNENHYPGRPRIRRAVLVSYGADGEHSATVTGRSAASLRIDGPASPRKSLGRASASACAWTNEPPPPPTPCAADAADARVREEARARVVEAGGRARQGSAFGRVRVLDRADRRGRPRAARVAVAVAAAGIARRLGSGLDHCCADAQDVPRLQLAARQLLGEGRGAATEKAAAVEVSRREAPGRRARPRASAASRDGRRPQQGQGEPRPPLQGRGPAEPPAKKGRRRRPAPTTTRRRRAHSFRQRRRRRAAARRCRAAAARGRR